MIHLEVVVADTADLLAAEAYGAGALLRWESAALVGGPYVEGGTVALVADVSLYDIWDAAGVAGTTWYQTRVSDAAGTTFSAYTAPFQTAEHTAYLSVDQFRAFESTALSDEALLILLDAAAQDIERYAGPSGATTEWLYGHGHLLMLGRSALSVTTVVESVWGSEVTLAANDYELSDDGTILRRLATGTNPRHHWAGRVTVTYEPVDDAATRQRVQLELVRLALTYNPGLLSKTIGTWSETYVPPASMDYATQRDAILATLSSPGVPFL